MTPISTKDVLEGPNAGEWTLAIQAEIWYLKANKTWELTIFPNGEISLSSIWIFEIKTKLDGSIDKFKARLITRGFSQIQSVAYTKFFLTCCQIKFYQSVTSCRYSIWLRNASTWCEDNILKQISWWGIYQKS